MNLPMNWYENHNFGQNVHIYRCTMCIAKFWNSQGDVGLPIDVFPKYHMDENDLSKMNERGM
jgi:hypothetical protein